MKEIERHEGEIGERWRGAEEKARGEEKERHKRKKNVRDRAEK
jgi:hypothetical protein